MDSPRPLQTRSGLRLALLPSLLALSLPHAAQAQQPGLAGPQARPSQAGLLQAGLQPGSAPGPQPGSNRASGAFYELHLGVDLPLLVASAALGSSWLLRGGLAAPHCAPTCERSTLPGFDRPAAGRYDTRARLVSDLGVLATLAGSGSILLIDGGLVDFTVGAEAVLATSAVAVLTMLAVRRPRPFAYGDRAPLSARSDGNASVSFPSGHTANAVAASLATFHILHGRHPDSTWPWVALGVGLASSSTIAVSRVLSGDHFPSDVIAGAVFGATLGWLVPELHLIAPTVTLAPSGTAGLALSASFP